MTQSDMRSMGRTRPDAEVDSIASVEHVSLMTLDVIATSTRAP